MLKYVAITRKNNYFCARIVTYQLTETNIIKKKYLIS